MEGKDQLMVFPQFSSSKGMGFKFRTQWLAAAVTWGKLYNLFTFLFPYLENGNNGAYILDLLERPNQTLLSKYRANFV